jgi:hypothetical protein
MIFDSMFLSALHAVDLLMPSLAAIHGFMAERDPALRKYWTII